MIMKQAKEERPFNLVRWFSILSSLSIVIITIISSLLLSRFLTDNMLHRDAVITGEFVQRLIAAQDASIYFEGTNTEGTKARVEALFNQIALMPEVVRVNIYDKAGTVLWSDDERFINHNFMPNPELIRALDGSIAIASGTGGKPIKPEHVFDKDVPFFVEFYMPIWNKNRDKVLGAFETYKEPLITRDKVFGAFEVYKEPLILFNAIKEGERLVWTTAVLGGIFLYASLFWIVRRAAFTIRRQQEEQIQSEKLVGIGVMAAGIAHEVNNPLAAMLGKAEMILEEKDSSHINKYAQDIIRFAKKTSDIVKEITLYSRRPSMPSNKNKISLNDQLEKAIKLSGYTNSFTHIELVKDFRVLPPVDGNTVEVEQVFVNLINNAIQAMNGRGRLVVRSRDVDGTAVVTIQDTGSGMKEEHLKQLFTPFFTTKNPGKGTGLVLNVVQKIITNHGGSISVESEEGHGATFIVKFPSADNTAGQGRKSGPRKIGKSVKETIKSWRSRT